MEFNRSSGILLHPTSLPGPFGIGDFGPQAYRWLDFLADSGCGLWQTLPLGPTGYADSPYQCFSAFAGNPYLISPELLRDDGLLTDEDLIDRPDFPADRVEYGTVIPWKLQMLQRAFGHFTDDPLLEMAEAFDRFKLEQSDWLDEYALFMALKDANDLRPWGEWDISLRMRQSSAMKTARKRHAEVIERHEFMQFIFFRQWEALRAYANQRGIGIIGDAPIFVAMDSSDVWVRPELFFLDENRQPTVVAGVPPDYFSPTGQLWGNPLYRWDAHREEKFSWWLKRIRAVLKLVDFVRLDHFRGFVGYWEVPAGNPTAEQGRWVSAPGVDLFKKIQSELGELPIIAEDLGVITPDVTALRDAFNLPGMKILQFAFSGPDNDFLPHYYPVNSVVYTGTHDNDTSLGWYYSAPEHEKDFARRYLTTDGTDFAWDLIRAIWASVAVFAIAPMQDFLSLGTEARMNYPSTVGGNWQWRMDDSVLEDEGLRDKIRQINYLYLR
ncbi:MAG: 4-alpha-glucanotransferase [Anaerolineales bacterium]|nr:4-alpha-glucanotransferase [Anaerolineales bacterium]